jgi:hypothetical protein
MPVTIEDLNGELGKLSQDFIFEEGIPIEFKEESNGKLDNIVQNLLMAITLQETLRNEQKSINSSKTGIERSEDIIGEALSLIIIDKILFSDEQKKIIEKGLQNIVPKSVWIDAQIIKIEAENEKSGDDLSSSEGEDEEVTVPAPPTMPSRPSDSESKLRRSGSVRFQDLPGVEGGSSRSSPTTSSVEEGGRTIFEQENPLQIRKNGSLRDSKGSNASRKLSRGVSFSEVGAGEKESSRSSPITSSVEEAPSPKARISGSSSSKPPLSRKSSFKKPEGFGIKPLTVPRLPNTQEVQKPVILSGVTSKPGLKPVSLTNKKPQTTQTAVAEKLTDKEVLDVGVQIVAQKKSLGDFRQQVHDRREADKKKSTEGQQVI